LDADDDSDPINFDNEVLDALAHLDSAPAAPTNIKTFKSVTPSARSHPPAGEPSGFASDSDGVHTDAYDGDSDEVVSDEDGNPAYATRSAGHGEKQSMFTSKSNLSHLAPKVSKSASIASLTEEGLRSNKSLLLGRRIKIHFPNYGVSWGKVIEYDVVKNLYKLEFSVDGETRYMSLEDVLTVLPKSWFGRKARAHQVRVVQSLVRAAHAACFLSIGRKPNKIAPLLNNFTEPGDYAMCCKAPSYEQWLEAMIKEIKELEKMGCWKIVKLTSLLPGAKLFNCRWAYISVNFLYHFCTVWMRNPGFTSTVTRSRTQFCPLSF